MLIFNDRNLIAMPTFPLFTCFPSYDFQTISFYARQPHRQVLLRARISYGDSVCLSVCPSGVSRPGTESSPGEIETPGFPA